MGTVIKFTLKSFRREFEYSAFVPGHYNIIFWYFMDYRLEVLVSFGAEAMKLGFP